MLFWRTAHIPGQADAIAKLLSHSGILLKLSGGSSSASPADGAGQIIFPGPKAPSNTSSRFIQVPPQP